MTHIFSGTWTPTGFVADDLDGWRTAKKVLQGKRVTVTVAERKHARSNEANRRYWGRIVGGVMAWMNVKPERHELPLSKEQVHYVLKSSFLGCLEVDGLLVPRDSHDLPPDKFSEYCDEVEGHFSALGCEFPNDW